MENGSGWWVIYSKEEAYNFIVQKYLAFSSLLLLERKLWEFEIKWLNSSKSD